MSAPSSSCSRAGWDQASASGAGCATHAAGDACGGRVHRHLHVERAAVGQADLPAQRIAEAFEANRLCPASILAVTGFLEPSVVFTVGTETLLTEGTGAAAHLKADPACAMAAVETGDDLVFQAAFADAAIKPVAIATFSGVNYTTGDKLDFKLYRLPAG